MTRQQAKVQKRIAFLFNIMLVCFLILAGRYGYLQLVQGDELRQLAMVDAAEHRSKQSPRGKILDRNGRELAISRMAKTLASMGHTVIGIDMADARVQLAEELLDTVYKADATSLSVLRSLHVQDLDWVVISVGEGVEQSLSITLNVQELGGPKIWVKASNEEHKKILQRLHVDRAIVPEMEAAVMAAHQLCHPGMLDLIPKYGGIAIQELRVDNWHGRTLVDLNLIQSFGVMVMGIRPAGERAFQFVPPALTVLHKGDTLVVAGRADAVRKLEP